MIDTIDQIDMNVENDVTRAVGAVLGSNMPKMYLTTTAEAFMAYRSAISQWLRNKDIRVEVLLWSQSQKARLLFENTNDAWSF